jgi:diaminohydroxyphosphoribosylaminopyrimidine deaminase/5-amino-6-(5-phosphoribosylamino)uracil reductase
MKLTKEKYIKRCIELAKNGLGTTYPNPLVGSVIVYNDQIIGEGWHRKSGESHAEVNAINSVKNKSGLAICNWTKRKASSVIPSMGERPII